MLIDFAEIPSNVSIELGTAPPPLRCRHMSLEAQIFWRVNDSPSGDFPDIRSGSINESGNIVYTLTVPGNPQYNGTMVECVAVFLNGLTQAEVTPAATILFTTTSPTIVPGILYPWHIIWYTKVDNYNNYSKF